MVCCNFAAVMVSALGSSSLASLESRLKPKVAAELLIAWASRLVGRAVRAVGFQALHLVGGVRQECLQHLDGVFFAEFGAERAE